MGLTLQLCCLRCHLYSWAMWRWALPMLVSPHLFYAFTSDQPSCRETHFSLEVSTSCQLLFKCDRPGSHWSLHISAQLHDVLTSVVLSWGAAFQKTAYHFCEFWGEGTALLWPLRNGDKPHRTRIRRAGVFREGFTEKDIWTWVGFSEIHRSSTGKAKSRKFRWTKAQRKVGMAML